MMNVKIRMGCGGWIRRIVLQARPLPPEREQVHSAVVRLEGFAGSRCSELEEMSRSPDCGTRHREDNEDQQRRVVFSAKRPRLSCLCRRREMGVQCALEQEPSLKWLWQ